MSPVVRNVVANYLGSAWVAIMGVAFVPVYLHFLGAEGYGLVGFLATLTAVIAIFDLGFGAAGAREMARLSGAPAGDWRDARQLVRTLEVVFWLISIAAAIVTILAAPIVVDRWLNLRALDSSSAVTAVRVMGCVLAFQLPTSLYNGCLVGLEKQVVLNIIGASVATMRGAGSALILWGLSPTLEAYFLFQGIVSGLNAWCARRTLWRAIPGEVTPAVDFLRLRRVARFAIGVGGINVLSLALMQTDKVLLSALLPLEEFGYYVLAWSLASLVYRICGPVFNAAYPRLTHFAALSEPSRLTAFYMETSRFMALMVVPISGFLVFSAEETLTIWTGAAGLAERAHWTVALLTVGTMLHALMHMPYALQLAQGWTRLSFLANAIAVLFLVPLTYLAARVGGLNGAAMVWPTISVAYLLAVAYATHRRTMFEQRWLWYRVAVLYPLAVTATTFALTKLTVSIMDLPVLYRELAYLGSMLLSAAIVLWTSPGLRERVAHYARHALGGS